ncbi:MAG: HPF/RaiA family ribosome-associated protein [Pseudobdellovibrionaceae bacterium]
MQTEVTFRNLTANKEVKQYLRLYTHQYLDTLENSHGLSVYIVCGKAAGRKDTHPPVFECHMLVRGNHLPKAIFAQNESEDLTLAIQSCLQSAKKQILKTEQKWRARRHEIPKNLEILQEEKETF